MRCQIRSAATIFLLLCFGSAQGGEKPNRIAEVRGGVGAPHLAAIEIAVSKFFPFSFGLGLGFVPKNLAKKAVQDALNIDPSQYKKEFAEGSIEPEFSMTWTSYQAFMRFHPYQGSFYVQGLYSQWNVQGVVDLKASLTTYGIDKMKLGTVSLKIVQPMVGAGCGWQWFTKSGLYFDFGMGVVKLLKPQYKVESTTILDTLGAYLPDSLNQEVNKGREQINSEIDKMMKDYHDKVQWGPVASLMIGYAFD